jgi:hypothetical protein
MLIEYQKIDLSEFMNISNIENSMSILKDSQIDIKSNIEQILYFEELEPFGSDE